MGDTGTKKRRLVIRILGMRIGRRQRIGHRINLISMLPSRDGRFRVTFKGDLRLEWRWYDSFCRSGGR